jgi:hypothetical protein
MNEAPAGPGPARTSGTSSGPAAVLRQLSVSLTELVIGGGLLAAHFLVPVDQGLPGAVTGGGGIGSLVAVIITARYRYEVRDGRVTTRELARGTRSADLTRLTSVIAPCQQEKFWGATLFGRTRWLELRDDRGSAVRLSFFGTRRGPRRRLLAAIEPYAMADGVVRTGLVREALDGQLWWPRPRG